MLFIVNTNANNVSAETYRYYNQLNKKQKSAYKSFIKGLKNTKKTRNINITVRCKEKDMLRALEAVASDAPQYFTGHLDLNYYEYKNKIKVIIDKINSKKTTGKIDKAAYLRDLEGENDIQTIKNIHDYLVDNVEYASPSNASADIQSLVGVFIYNEAVCEGYARAFKYLCDIYEIPCILVTGVAVNPDSANKEDAHMWNYVRLNGDWYGMDVTWDDNISGYEYFLVGSNSIGHNGLKFSNSHKRGKELMNFNISGIKGFKYPKLSEISYFKKYPEENILP